ncbi:helix-turn-helix domain-containing protein [Verrucosispora sp. WMMD573]|uniref:winged helix-turn-helix transcriptional regulator n=1 Tax=Verrucosispora sp. WMMD573 TaxID=3015149 RepID=UPI00248B14ED|nr:helix-turn-helix domain-containing protein [Verrucosispora sp. WMMD573]WBB53417.1 helix-turn-helix domain-containing protein [Verrucosispora sp. WMMD573]
MSTVHTGAPPGAPRPTGPRARIPDCPLGRTVEVVGPWWTLEILHELFNGNTRLGIIRHNLGTPVELLLERLADLRTRGLIEQVAEAPDPDGREYRLTPFGRTLRPLLLVIAAWGNHRLAPQDRSVILVDTETGAEVEPVVVDRRTGRRIDNENVVFARGPKASAMVTARYPKIMLTT